MNEPVTLYETDELRVVALPADGPRGAKLELEIRDDEGATVAGTFLLEGQARKLHLMIRQWIRRQKSLRGDTPRGVRSFEISDRQYRRPRAAARAG
jgi:hypothetical protein